MLRKYVGEHQDDWDRFASAVTYAYNMTVQRSTVAKPFELVLSRPLLPFALQQSTARRRQGKNKGKDSVILSLLEQTIVKAIANLSAAQERYKREFEKRPRAPLPTIEPSDWVFLDPVRRTGQNNKLARAADAPFRVLATGEGTIVIKRVQSIESVNCSRV